MLAGWESTDFVCSNRWQTRNNLSIIWISLIAIISKVQKIFDCLINILIFFSSLNLSYTANISTPQYTVFRFFPNPIYLRCTLGIQSLPKVNQMQSLQWFTLHFLKPNLHTVFHHLSISIVYTYLQLIPVSLVAYSRNVETINWICRKSCFYSWIFFSSSFQVSSCVFVSCQIEIQNLHKSHAK